MKEDAFSNASREEFVPFIGYEPMEEIKANELVDQNDPNLGKTELCVQGLDINTNEDSLRAAF